MDRKIEKKKITPRRIAWGIGILLMAILIIYGFFSLGSGSTLRLEKDRLTIAEVGLGEFQEFIPVNGTIMPIRTFYLDATQGGTVVEVYLQEGTFVNAGDKILKLDNTDMQLDIMYREAQLFEQINNLRNTRLAMEQNSLRLKGDLLEIDYQIRTAKRDYEQSISLKEKNLISRNEFERSSEKYDYWKYRRELTIETQRQDSILRVIQIEQLEASVQRMQANLEIVKKKLDNLELKAPISGQLSLLNAEVGESKSRGERLGQIDILDGFKVNAGVDEYYISRINTGLSGEVTIAGDMFNLKIARVYPEVRDGRFQIDLEFVGAVPDNIRRGQTIRIRLFLGDLSDAVLIPRGGFYNTTGGNWIYVLDKSGDFAIKRDITLGRYNPKHYEVLDGLEPGEKVITSSYDNYADFDRLVLKEN
jgi:HlyD family secretion protein